MDIKTCTKCNEEFPATAEFFYKNTGGKFGVTPRCKKCVNEDNEAGHKRRLLANPEKIRAQATARSKKHYHADLETSRKRGNVAATKARLDPEKRARINMRKRAGGAGLTEGEFNTLFKSQGNKCAICGATEAGGIGTVGWNIDHCHKTGNVRFILCCHCNRGLGAFRDKPELMRKAADLLEDFYDCKSTSAA